MPADVKRPSPDATASNWKGQSGYAGATKSRDKMSSQERIAAAQPGYSKPAAANKAATRDVPKAPPKVQGSYAGAKGDRAKPAAPSTRDLQQPKPQTRDVPQQAKPQQQPEHAKAQQQEQAKPPHAKPQQQEQAKPQQAKPQQGPEHAKPEQGKPQQQQQAKPAAEEHGKDQNKEKKDQPDKEQPHR